MSKLGRVLCVGITLTVVGCGGGSGTGDDSGNDSGTVPGTDSGTPGTDASTPGRDAGTPGTDSAITPTDSGAPVDAGTEDAHGARDPRITSDPDPDEVACGGATCHPSSSEVCCVSLTGMTCKAAGSCTGLAAPAACDGPEDCPSGQRCCVGFPAGASCGATACTGTAQELCNYEEDCAGRRCTPCSAPGSSLIYGLCTADSICPSPYTNP